MEAVVGIAGVFVGAMITYLFQRFESNRTSRRRAAEDLTREWHSPEMVRARVIGYDVLARNIASSAPGSFESVLGELMRGGHIEDWVEVSRVIHYLDLAAIMYRNHQVDRLLFADHMGSYVEYWYSKVLQPTAAISLSVDPSDTLGWYSRVAGLARALNATSTVDAK